MLPKWLLIDFVWPSHHLDKQRAKLLRMFCTSLFQSTVRTRASRKKSTLSIVPELRYKSMPVWNHCHCLASTLNLCFSNGFTWMFGRPCRDFTGFYLLRQPYRNEPGMGALGRITPGSAASRARASWVTEVSKEGRTYKDKGEPIGTAPDPLAGTAVDCVISWKSFVLDISCSRHRRLATCSWPACSWHFWILTALLVGKVLPSTTSYYKACTKDSPYYFVLQSLHKVLPSTTSYYKACTQYFPVVLRTTKLAQSSSQYYFLLQSYSLLSPSLIFPHPLISPHLYSLHLLSCPLLNPPHAWRKSFHAGLDELLQTFSGVGGKGGSGSPYCQIKWQNQMPDKTHK